VLAFISLLVIDPVAPRADDDCAPAIATAQRDNQSLPAGLLNAIGTVESGRRDPATGRFAPWPWSVNAAGDSRFFTTREQAIAFVQAAQASGIRSIDVGCMQINLMYHPDAFGSLWDAFAPETNVRYAARFLLDLYQRAGDWPTASGDYHSATPGLSEAYAHRVQAALGPGVPAAGMRDPFGNAVPAGPAALIARVIMVFGPGGGREKKGVLRAVGALPPVFGPGSSRPVIWPP